MRAETRTRRRPSSRLRAAGRRKRTSRRFAHDALSRPLTVAKNEQILKVALLHSNLLQLFRNVSILVIDRATQMIVPRLKLELQVTSRRTYPFISLPLPLAAHILCRNFVFVRADFKVFNLVRPRKIWQTTRFQYQVLDVRAPIEHLHRLDAQRTAQMDPQHDERTVPSRKQVHRHLVDLRVILHVDFSR